MREENIK
jgi:hypothetical protein